MVNKVVLAGGGVLGVQIALMCAYTGHDTTFWLRSEGSIGRTQPKIDRYEAAILKDLENCKGLIGNPMASYLYPRALFDSPADPKTIDLTWKLGTGAPKGPFEILDIVGLDTAYNIISMQPEAQKEGTPLNKFAAILKEKIDKGEKGINFGKGFYDYTRK